MPLGRGLSTVGLARRQLLRLMLGRGLLTIGLARRRILCHGFLRWMSVILTLRKLARLSLLELQARVFYLGRPRVMIQLRLCTGVPRPGPRRVSPRLRTTE